MSAGQSYLDERLYQHKKGRGAKFCGAARERGIKFVLAECWVADKSFERTIKRQKNHKRFCPICTNLVDKNRTMFARLMLDQKCFVLQVIAIFR